MHGQLRIRWGSWTHSEENALAQVPHSTVWGRKDYKASAEGTGNRSPVGLETLLLAWVFEGNS